MDKILRSTTMVAILALTALETSCAAPQPLPLERSTQSSAQALTGRAIFSGLYFSEGPAAKILDAWSLRKTRPTTGAVAPTPAVAANALRSAARQLRADNMDTTATNLETVASRVARLKPPTNLGARRVVEQRSKMLTAVLDAIAKKDKTFFDRFAKGMKSGTHTKVDRSIKEGTVRLLAAIGTLGASAAGRAAPSSGRKGFADEGGGDEGDLGGDSGGDTGESDQGGYDEDPYGSGSGSGGDTASSAEGSGSAGGDTAGGADSSGPGGAGENAGGAESSGTDSAGGNAGGVTSSGSSGDGDLGAGGEYGDPGDPASTTDDVSVASAVQINMYVWFDTAIAVLNVAAAHNTLAFSQSEGGDLQTATFIDHLTEGFAE